MSSTKIGVGIIGIQPGRSWAAIAHIPALQSLADDYQIMAVSTTRQESADNAAHTFGIPHAFDSVEKLCACEGVDLVAVTVKVPHHFELVEKIIAAGKHVYCEWPLGNGIHEARRMTEFAANRGVVAVCGMQARFSPVLSYVRDLVAQGYVGKVLSSTLVGSGLNWGETIEQPNAYTAEASNGATMLAIPVGHTLDAVCLTLGEFTQLNAVLGNRRTSTVVVETGQTIPMTTHDQVLVSGTLESGIPISVHYRGGVNRGTGLLWEINGTGGDLQVVSVGGHAQLLDLTLMGGKSEDVSVTPMEVPENYFKVPVDGALAGNVARFYQALSGDIRKGTTVCPTFDDAVRRHQMVEAIEASAKKGTVESPDNF